MNHPLGAHLTSPWILIPLQAACAIHFTIPLRGLSESLNVSVAAAIALHWGRVGREAALGKTSDLETDELESVRRDYRRLGRERGFQKGVRRAAFETTGRAEESRVIKYSDVFG